MREHRYYVYIVASRSQTLYIGFTGTMERRMQQHKEGTHDGFSKQYQCNRLVYLEKHDEVNRAIDREKQLKRWSGAKKITLIERANPTWQELSEGWGDPLTIPIARADATTSAGLSTTATPPVEMTDWKLRLKSWNDRFARGSSNG